MFVVVCRDLCVVFYCDLPNIFPPYYPEPGPPAQISALPSKFLSCPFMPLRPAACHRAALLSQALRVCLVLPFAVVQVLLNGGHWTPYLTASQKSVSFAASSIMGIPGKTHKCIQILEQCPRLVHIGRGFSHGAGCGA